MPPLILHERRRSPPCSIERRRWWGGNKKKKSCVKEGVRRRDAPATSSLTWNGVSLLYILQSPPSFLRCSRVFQPQSANVIARGRDVARNRADGLTGIPGRAAVRRPSADGTVTRNASPASGGRITTTLVLLLPLPPSTRARGVAAPRRRRKRGEERRLVASRRNGFGKLVWMLDRHWLRLCQKQPREMSPDAPSDTWFDLFYMHIWIENVYLYQ